MGDSTRRFWNISGVKSETKEESPERSRTPKPVVSSASMPANLPTAAIETAVVTGIEKTLGAEVGRRAFFRTAGLGAAAILPEVSAVKQPVGLLKRLSLGASDLMGKTRFASKAKTAAIRAVIPGAKNIISSLLGAESGLMEFADLASNITTGTADLRDPAELMQRYEQCMGTFNTAAPEFDAKARDNMVTTLMEAGRIQDQIDAWNVIIDSPHNDQRVIAMGQHKRMADDLDDCLTRLGIDEEQWQSINRDSFAQRVLKEMVIGKKGNVADVINSERGSTISSAIRAMGNRAKFYADDAAGILGTKKTVTDPKKVAEFFDRGAEIMGVTPDSDIGNPHSVFESSAKSFFGKHAGLKPEGWDDRPKAFEKPATPEPAKPDLSAAHDQLVMADPEMASWLIKARVVDDQKKLTAKNEEAVAVGAGASRA